MLFIFNERITVLHKIVIGLDAKQVRQAVKRASETTGASSADILEDCIHHCLSGKEFDDSLIGGMMRAE